MYRRHLLKLAGGMVVLAGCSGDDDDTPQDSDGDGVIDENDYAPYDPDVQEKSDLTSGTETPTDTQTTESSTPIPSPTPTETETPLSNPTATLSPTVSPSPTATRTPSPTPTESPTPTPTPSPTPTPTATQTPTPTPEPTPAPDEDSYSFSGSSDTATGKFELAGGLATFEFTHEGDSNFIVWLLDNEGEQEKLLVNAIGEWDGTIAYNVTNQNYLLDIDANGSWTANVQQPRYSTVEVDSLPVSLETTNSDYLGPVRLGGLTRASLNGKDDEHYGVWLMNHHGENVELLFNEIGPYEGDTAFSAEGVALIQVETNGAYTIESEDG